MSPTKLHRCAPVLLAAVMALTGACVAENRPIAEPQPLGPVLEGSWQGTLRELGTAEAPSRIALDLRPDGDAVVGALSMKRGAEPRSVRFTLAPDGTRFTTTVGPYVDTACNCEASTVLFATVRDGELDGTFTTRRDGDEVVGLWGARRVSDRVSLRP